MVNILLDLFKYVKLYLKQDSSQMLIKQLIFVLFPYFNWINFLIRMTINFKCFETWNKQKN